MVFACSCGTDSDVSALLCILFVHLQGSWEDALRVAKVYGGPAASKQVSQGPVLLGGKP